jgi:hypothetical protein
LTSPFPGAQVQLPFARPARADSKRDA